LVGRKGKAETLALPLLITTSPKFKAGAENGAWTSAQKLKIPFHRVPAAAGNEEEAMKNVILAFTALALCSSIDAGPVAAHQNEQLLPALV
jgi:hypothetical protein